MVADSRLHSLASGKAASDEDNINCDQAEEVGLEIMKKMDDVAFSEVVSKKADQVRTLDQVGTKGSASIKKLNIDSTILFSRLLLIMQRSAELKPFFDFELTPVPTALFTTDGCLRKCNKFVLARELKKNIQESCATEPRTYVVDGGFLLHRVNWQQMVTYADTFQRYVQYVISHFGMNVTIVFDGYCNGPNMKDHEHDRWSLRAAPDIVFDENNPVYNNRTAFLTNESKKKAFLSNLICKLRCTGISVHQALDDADTLIVATAITIARSNRPVTVVANDTDVLVLLTYHFRSAMADIVLRSEITKRGSPKVELIPTRAIQDSIGDAAAKQILVAHAISGCDTTSCLYGLGKASILKKFSHTTKKTLPLSEILSSSDATHDDISAAGLKLLTLLYGGKASDTLNHMRYVQYMNKTASCYAQPRPERLPPTQNAATYHVYRTHLQVVQWQTLLATDIQPTDWGWKISNDRYVPIQTDLQPAPGEILNVVRCKCKVEGRRPCSTRLCSCMKHGLSCVAACKNCYGDQCENVAKTDNDDLPSEEESNTISLEDLIPEDCLQFDIPWLDE